MKNLKTFNVNIPSSRTKSKLIVWFVGYNSIGGSVYLHDLRSKNPFVFSLHVQPKYRKNGIGTKLMQKCIEICKKNKKRTLSLSVHKNNKAIKLYKNFGFKPLGKVQGRKNELYMSLTLKRSKSK